MRPLETMLLVVNLPLVAWCFYKRGQPAGALLVPLSALVVLALHLVIEGYRWQLAPGYLATGLLFASCVRSAVLKPGPWMGAFVFVCLFGAAVVGTIMPVFSFPTPTGPFLIGSITRHLIDNSRAETQGNRNGERRELMIKIWYPADQTGTREIYRSDTPLTLLNHHLRLVKLHSFMGVPVAKSQPRFPVVIVSPAWTATCSQYVFLAEELASHGFLVVGIDHSYGSHRTIFPDGRIIGTVLNKSLDCSSDEALEASVRMFEAQLAIRTADVRFALDELERFDRDDPSGFLTGRIALSHVGVCGHSFGGAVAADACTTDARFKAGINLDGLIFGAPTTKKIGKPFLLVSDDGFIPTPAEVRALDDKARRYWTFQSRNAQCVRQSLAGGSGYWFTLRGASHMNFHDIALYSPLRRFTGAGPIPPQRAMEITNAYILAFLQTYMCGERDHLLDAPFPRYPEVVVFEQHLEQLFKGDT